MKRRVFPPLLCAIILDVVSWRSSFRFTIYRGPSLNSDELRLILSHTIGFVILYVCLLH